MLAVRCRAAVGVAGFDMAGDLRDTAVGGFLPDDFSRCTVEAVEPKVVDEVLRVVGAFAEETDLEIGFLPPFTDGGGDEDFIVPGMYRFLAERKHPAGIRFHPGRFQKLLPDRK